jgi:hypothetical protein
VETGICHSPRTLGYHCHRQLSVAEFPGPQVASLVCQRPALILEPAKGDPQADW